MFTFRDPEEEPTNALSLGDLLAANQFDHKLLTVEGRRFNGVILRGARPAPLIRRVKPRPRPPCVPSSADVKARRDQRVEPRSADAAPQAHAAQTRASQAPAMPAILTLSLLVGLLVTLI